MSVGLSLEGCRERQGRLRKLLATENLNSALITDPRHVYYFSGYWSVGRALKPSAFLIEVEGRSTLACPGSPESSLAAEEIISYSADHLGTLLDDPDSELWSALESRVKQEWTIGADRLPLEFRLDHSRVRPLLEQLFTLRRTKHSDEVAMLQAGIGGCDAAYTRARELLQTRVTEVELYASMRAAATEALGEPLTDFGNDFQCGTLGSLPRNRVVETGETAILDLGVVYRGYGSDLCRTFVIGGQPSEAQTAAHERVMQAIKFVEETVRPGISCKDVYREVFAMIDGFRGWSFPHHLGHGIGLSAHEAPRLNPHWEDTFQVGDVFTAEPGLYGEELRAGIRIENDYLVTADGIERLSHFPTELA